MIKKNRFTEKTKKVMAMTALMCMMLIFTGCGSGTDNGASTVSDNISMDQAIEIALSSAGISRDNAANLHVEYDEHEDDASGPVYNVIFHADGSEYDYTIQALNGTIVTFDVNKDDSLDSDNTAQDLTDNDSETDTNDSENDTTNSDASGETSADSNYIGVDKAKEIALTHAGVNESDVTFQKAKLSYDDGQHEYELEFYSDTVEYDYEIDAHTGKIIDWDHDNFEQDWD